MCKAFRITVTTAAIGIAVLSLTAPARAGNGSAVGAGLVGFGIGAILGSVLVTPEVYLIPPPPPDYYGPVAYGPTPGTPNWYSNPAYPRSNTPPHAAANGREPGPTRSTTVKTGAVTGAEQKAEVKFKAPQAKAKRDGVQTLTRKDIDGLSYEQIK
jgi:hypothetical protein